MHRLQWLLVFLLVVGCGKDTNKKSYLSPVSVEGALALDVPPQEAKAVAIYGFLAEKNELLFLYPSEKFYSFKGAAADNFRVQIWYPEGRFNKECVNMYVVVYGRIHDYIAAPGVDDILEIVSLESNDLLCWERGDIINYFNYLKSAAID